MVLVLWVEAHADYAFGVSCQKVGKLFNLIVPDSHVASSFWSTMSTYEVFRLFIPLEACDLSVSL